MIKIVSVLLALGVSVGSTNAKPVPIFGLPLGGKPETPIPVCKESDLVALKKPCFLEKPFFTKDGGGIGTLKIPESSVPEWAAYSRHRLFIDQKGFISHISVEQKDARLVEIIDSISKRFGAPTQVNLFGTRIPTALWDLSEIYIKAVQWDNACCEVQFWSPSAIIKHREFLERSKINRPETP